MKKSLLFVAALGLALPFSACEKKADGDAAAATSETAAPTGGSAALQDYIKSYDAFVKDYVEAAKAAKGGDMSKMTAITAKAQEFATKSQEVAGKLSADDAQKLQEYILKKAEEMQKAME